jgi:hypothetical protein
MIISLFFWLHLGILIGREGMIRNPHILLVEFEWSGGFRVLRTK